MVFVCSLCSAITPGKGRRLVGKCRVTADNLPAAQNLLWGALEAEAVPHVAALKEGDTLCLQCFPEELREQVTTRVQGKQVVGTSHVGQPAADWTSGEMRLGTVVDFVLSPAGYLVQWAGADGAVQEKLSVDDTAAAVQLGLWISARDRVIADEIKVRAQKREQKARERAQARDAEDVDDSADDAVADGAVAEALSDEEQRLRQRCLSRRNLFDGSWWREQGKMGEKLHRHLFNFDTTGQMRHFFDVAFRSFRGEPLCYGLGPFELMALALLKMKTGRPWVEIEADMGALLGKGRLTARITVWIHRLGSFSKQALVGLPSVQYMDEGIPQIYRDCDMRDAFQIGDGTVFMTETPRRGIFKGLKNQLWNDKTEHAGALGVSACDARSSVAL